MIITRKYEFDAGHRIPSHLSKCRHLHGHRYVVEVSLEGLVQPERGQSDDAMVADFGDLKFMIADAVDPWDHAMLIYKDDPALIGMITADLGIVVVPFIPTAENMVAEIAKRITRALAAREMTAIRVYNVRLYETPNCWADSSGL